MRICLIGTYALGTLEFSYLRAFKELGCHVRCFNLARVSPLFAPFQEYLLNLNIFRTLDTFQPDLVLVIKGLDLWPKTIKKLKGIFKDTLFFCFNGDDPFNLASTGATNKNILGAIQYYDCYFTWTKRLMGKLLETGAGKVVCLPFGFDPDWHNLVNLSDAQRHFYANDVTFVGNWDRERESWLKNVQDFDLGIWGEKYWNTRCQNSALRKKWRRRPAYAQDMAKVLAAAKASLNILRVQNKGTHNMRTFEAPACGAFILAESSDEAKEFFEEDKEAVYFADGKELRDKLDYYLRHEKERKEISQAGYLRCLKSNYSYFYRARDILNCYGGFIE